MRVKSLVDHSNDYGVRDGGSYDKKKGTVYEIAEEADAQVLIDAGLVEKEKAAAKE